MFEELKLKIKNFERLEKDRFEEQKLHDVENQNLVEELGKVRSQIGFAQEQWEKKASDFASKILRGKEEIVRLGKQRGEAFDGASRSIWNSKDGRPENWDSKWEIVRCWGMKGFYMFIDMEALGYRL